MASNIEEVINESKDMYKKVLGDLSEYELGIIENLIRFPFVKNFHSVSSITDTIQTSLTVLSQVNYIRQKIVQIIYSFSIDYDKDYDKSFTLYTRMGRPSKQAIESEMFSTKPELRQIRDKLREAQNLLEYTDSLISILNSSVHNYENHRYKF